MATASTTSDLHLFSRAGTPHATFEGRTFSYGGTDYQTPESLRAAALAHQERAKREARAARFALALAERMEQEQAEAAAQAAAQRRERAAATRARRADPFGHKALLGRAEAR